MAMIPMIAGYFEVSLDALFGYDLRKVRIHIRKILDEAQEYFYDDPARYADTVRAALADNPGNEELLCALLNSYEHTLRNFNDRAHLDEIIDLSYQIISSSRDFAKVCDVKDILSAAYLKMGRYDKAKEILESLPVEVTLKWDAMSFRLSGQDKIDAAREAAKVHLQGLYLACWEEGNGLYAGGEYQAALEAYDRGLTVLTAFLVPGGVAGGAYLWAGMQTFHYGFHLLRAACLKKLGRAEECPGEVARAYEIVSTAWSDFAENTNYYMENFFETLDEYGLNAYKR